MDTILALSTAKTVRKLRSPLKRVQLDLKTLDKGSSIEKQLEETSPDLILLDITLPAMSDFEILRMIREYAPKVPIILTNVTDCDVATIRGLLKSSTRRLAQHQPPDQLFHPDSGRIDAGHVAAFFGLPQARLARILGHSPQAVHKTPDAERLQNKLAVYVRIATALFSMFGSEQKARTWLNAPNPDLDNARPKQLLARGKAAIVAELLEDALLGHPT